METGDVTWQWDANLVLHAIFVEENFGSPIDEVFSFARVH